MEKTAIGNIQVTLNSLNELDGNQVIVSIPKAEIRSVTLCNGESVERPVRQLISGGVFIVLGFVIGVWPLAGIIFNHEVIREAIAIKPFVMAIPSIFIGTYLIIPIFQKNYYLRVQTISAQRKLPIKGVSPSAVIDACKSFNYPVSEGPEGTYE
jgi:hypothetical protein